MSVCLSQPSRHRLCCHVRCGSVRAVTGCSVDTNGATAPRAAGDAHGWGCEHPRRDRAATVAPRLQAALRSAGVRRRVGARGIKSVRRALGVSDSCPHRLPGLRVSSALDVFRRTSGSALDAFAHGSAASSGWPSARQPYSNGGTPNVQHRAPVGTVSRSFSPRAWHIAIVRLRVARLRRSPPVPCSVSVWTVGNPGSVSGTPPGCGVRSARHSAPDGSSDPPIDGARRSNGQRGGSRRSPSWIPTSSRAMAGGVACVIARSPRRCVLDIPDVPRLIISSRCHSAGCIPVPMRRPRVGGAIAARGIESARASSSHSSRCEEDGS